MFNFRLTNWTLAVDTGNPPVLQYDDNSVVLRVTGDIPEGWTWELLLAHGEYLDIAHMDEDEEGLTVLLTAEQLAFDGYYTAQLRATQGDRVKHSAPALFAVGHTYSGDEQWPEIPTAFSQALERAEAAAETAQEVESTVIEAAEATQTAAASAADSATAAAGSASAARAAQTSAETAQSAAETAADDVSEMVDRMGNVPVVSGTGYTATGTGVTETLTKTNIKTGAQTSETVPMPIANDESAGLMTPEQVAAIEELESRVGGLENQNVRLSYTAGSSPTAEQILAFVVAAGYTDTTRWASIGVVISATNHIWRYYSNTQTWTDIGLDTVQQASGTIKGIVQGSSTAGKVFVEADGTMSLNGYDALTSGIANLQSGKQDAISDLDTIRSGAEHAVRFDGQVLTTAQQAAAQETLGLGMKSASTLPANAAVNTIYSLGTAAAVTTALPNGTKVGDMVSIIWYNGASAATVNITGQILPFSFTPAASNRSEVNAMWDGTNWSLVAYEQEVGA